MVQCMNAPTDKVHKQEVPHTHSDMHSITWPHYSTTIPSSGTSVGTKFTAT